MSQNLEDWIHGVVTHLKEMERSFEEEGNNSLTSVQSDLIEKLRQVLEDYKTRNPNHKKSLKEDKVVSLCAKPSKCHDCDSPMKFFFYIPAETSAVKIMRNYGQSIYLTLSDLTKKIFFGELFRQNIPNPPPTILTESQVERSVQDKVFQNPLLLTQILSKLDPSSLKTCRLLNSNWNHFSCQTLIKQNVLQLSLHHDPKYHSFFVKKGNEFTSTAMELVNHLLAKSRDFPCTQLHIEGDLILDDNLKTFLLQWGSQIKDFKLNYSDDTFFQKYFDSFKTILVEYSPQIQSIYLSDVTNKEREQTLDQAQEFELPTLKTLTFDCCYSEVDNFDFLRLILKAAVNLQQIFPASLDIELAVVMVETGKSHLLKEIRGFLHPGNIYMFQTVANSKSPVHLDKLSLLLVEEEQFEIELQRSRMIKALTKIFKASSKSMRSLTMEFPIFDQLPNFVIPPMPGLNELILNDVQDPQIEFGTPGKWRLLPASFPALSRLTLAFSDGQLLTTTIFERVFPSILPTINYLKIDCVTSSFVVELSQVLPNLKWLVLNEVDIGQWPTIGRHIWTCMQGIECLQVELNIDDEDEEKLHLGMLFEEDYNLSDFFQLNSTFIGCCEETCRLLRKNLNKVTEEDLDLAGMRVNPSILNLKGLRELDVTLLWFENCVRNHDYSDMSLDLTNHLLSSLMPNLKVKTVYFPRS